MSQPLVIGFGGAGRNIAMAFHEATACEWLAVDRDSLRNRALPKKRRFFLDSHGSGQAKHLPEEQIQRRMPRLMTKLGPKLEGTEKTVLVGSLGGATGGPALLAFAQSLNEAGIAFQTGALLPFDFEGAERLKLAELNLERLLRLDKNAVVHKMLARDDHLPTPSRSLTDYLDAVNAFFIQQLAEKQ